VGPVIGIETATPHRGVALTRGAEILAELQVCDPRSHAEGLLPSIDSLLSTAGLRATDLAAVAVSTGPGSFTGLRIGLAAAKGLAFSLQLPLYSIPTLEVLASNAAPRETPVCPFIDARRGEIFSALFNFIDGELVKARGEGIMGSRELLASLPEHSLLLGEPPPPFLAALKERRPAFPLAPSHLGYPRAAAVALKGGLLLADGRPSEGENLVPFYLRPSDAEANRQKKDRRLKRA
jgi:tRNA threonylcarbamoyladenosine biosynthesis protein TsaB